MRKFWIIAKHEYLKITRKRSFLLGTLAMPLFFVGFTALAIVVVMAGEDQKPLGYVDQAGVLTTVTLLPPDEDDGPNPVALRAFADEAQARVALDNGEIQGYYVLPADYLTSHTVQLVYWDKFPRGQARFDKLVRANLSTSLPAAAAERVQEGINLTARSADGRQEVSGESFINFFVPEKSNKILLFIIIIVESFLNFRNLLI